MQAALELTDQKVVELIGKAIGPVLTFIWTIIGVLSGGIISLVVWIYKSGIKQFTEYRKDRKHETEAFEKKFEAINQYMSESSSRHAVHETNMDNLGKWVNNISKDTKENTKSAIDHEAQLKILTKKNK